MSIDSANGLRERMAVIRTRARGKADRLGKETRQFLDWRHYVRLHPWGSLAVAAAVGYLAVPRRTPVRQLDRETIARLAGVQRLAIAPPEPARRPGLVDSAFQLLANSLLRAGIAFVGQQIGRIMAPPPNESAYRESGHDFAGHRR